MMVFDDIVKWKVRFRTRRGLLELDLIFGRLMEKESGHLSDDELACLMEISVFQDQEFLSLINGSRTTDKAHLVPILEKIRQLRSNGRLRRQWRSFENEDNGQPGRYFYKGII